MRSTTPSGSRSRSIFTLLSLSLAASLFVVPAFFVSEAGPKQGKGLSQRTSAQDPELPNYDIRTEKQAYQKLAEMRERNGRSAAMTADVRDRFVRGENDLKSKVRNLKVEYSPDLNAPEVIAADSASGKNFLTGRVAGDRPNALRNFLRENADLLGLDENQVARLKVTADYTNPDGNLSFVELTQEINGVPVFRGEVKAGFTRDGEIFRVINNLAPAVEDGATSTNFGEPGAAANAAAGHVKRNAAVAKVKVQSAEDEPAAVLFSDGTAGQAEKMYFPTEPGVVVPAWRVMVSNGPATYYAIVDAETGTLLWRKNLTEDQTQPATYNVYANPNAMINVAENPFPLTPGPINPALGTQGGALSRTQVTLIGNEAPYSFNNLGWITDGGNTTDGNNVQAGLDRKTPNTGSPANPADLDPDGMAVGVNRTFDFPFTPGNPNNSTGDSPLPAGQSPATCLEQTDTSLPTDYQKAITTQLFYITNRYHDEMYLLGFTEAARNFQNLNFTGQGLGNDRISAQAQDCSGTSNANFTTPADGSRPTMQMYIFTGPEPDFDGSLDADVVVHELTHGLSNRLHNNASGLITNMSRGMGEGWSDFYSHSLLSEPNDPIDGIYTTGGYATRNIAVGFTGNYYYGIRRYPKAILAATGGANSKPHNAYTFSYLNANCNARMTDTNFAYGRGPVGSTTCDQVHNVGEIWSSILWEARAKIVQRYGWAVGNRKMLQFVTDGMKLSPVGPTFLQARDAILAAARASGTGQDVADLWAGFAARGLGFSASIQSVGSGSNNTAVTDGFDLPNLLQTPAITVSDASTGDNDGYPEPGEEVMITVPLSNTTGQTATDVSATIVGGSTVSYGTIANNGAASNQIRYTVPTNVACGGALNITINVTSSLGPTSFVRTIIPGTPVTTFTENFDSVTAPAFPAGWTVATELNGSAFVNSTLVTDSAPNSAFAINPTTVGGGTTLTSPSMPITAGAAVVTFRNRYNTEAGWDGGVLEVSINGGEFQDILAAGGAFLQNGYNGSLGVGTNNPLNGRSAWNGSSNGFVTSSARLPASAAGQNVQLRWRFGADNNTVGVGANPGWNIDNVSVAGSFTCSAFGASNVRSDFDGDGKTDVSVFRPSNGSWYMQGSTQGFFGFQWGMNQDVPTPADFDQDGKTDVAVYRPGQNGTFFVLKSNDSTVSVQSWGLTGDIPVVRDYDGDTFPDIAVFRPSDGRWYIQKSSGGMATFQFGQTGDIPVAGDFDGDGKGDLTIYRNGDWWIANSSGGFAVIGWGNATDRPVPADYDGDGKDDVAIYRPETGSWWILRSNGTGNDVYQWGNSTDQPVPGDYDGDSKADVAIYRSGAWWLALSGGGYSVANFGLPDDKPTLRGYLP